jgi:hypothetical protein
MVFMDVYEGSSYLNRTPYETLLTTLFFQKAILIFLHILTAPLYTVITTGQLHYASFIKSLLLPVQISLHKNFNSIIGSKSVSS